MSVSKVFLMAGGGTGGHVIPALAVAEELRKRGHQVYFVGTKEGMEAKLVPAAGFEIEWIEIGGLKRVGAVQMFRTLGQLPASVMQVSRRLESRRPAAVFSMGGYVAGPVVLAAWLRKLPVIVMEPNAIPGMTNRKFGRFVAKALLSFPEAARFFPQGKTEITGLPVRDEFFNIKPKPTENVLKVLITGGSRGSHTLNNAARQSWPLLKEAGTPVHIVHQTGDREWVELATEFKNSGLKGEVTPFINDMPGGIRSRGHCCLPRWSGLSGGVVGGRQTIHPGSLPFRRRRSSATQCRSNGEGGRSVGWPKIRT